jgi:hypothetical protein
MRDDDPKAYAAAQLMEIRGLLGDRLTPGQAIRADHIRRMTIVEILADYTKYRRKLVDRGLNADADFPWDELTSPRSLRRMVREKEKECSERGARETAFRVSRDERRHTS